MGLTVDTPTQLGNPDDYALVPIERNQPTKKTPGALFRVRASQSVNASKAAYWPELRRPATAGLLFFGISAAAANTSFCVVLLRSKSIAARSWLSSCS